MNMIRATLTLGVLALVLLGPSASAASTEFESTIVVVGGGSCSIIGCAIDTVVYECNWATWQVDHGSCT